MKKIIFLFFVISHFVTNAQSDLPIQLDSLISSTYKSISPGCVVLVAKNDSIIYKKAFGVANIELNVPMKPDMIFRLGSITKQYTAVSILQLVEQGKISLQDSIQKFIKDFPYKGHTITIENLLTHTSGIVDYEVLNFPIPTAIRVDFPPKQIIDSLSKLPLDFTPSSQFHYSNSNYFLLAYIIEQVSGKSYQDYLAENIFKPAGLTNTFYDSPTEIIPNRINGYAKYNGKYFNAGYISMSQVYGAGALVSNVDDMFKWHEALYNYKLIKKETLEKACTPFMLSDGTKSTYGYGWFIKNRNDYTSIEHAGGIDGFQSDEIYLPDQNIFIATLYNSLNEGGDDPAFMALDNDIATLSVGKKLEHEIEVDSNILKQYVGQYDFDKKHHAYITLENGQLQIEAPQGGLPKVPLFAKSENVFFLKIIAAEVEFAKDENGKISQMIIHVNGENQICKKVK
ncbi:MAG TPA: serine hydrolase [Parafilimonas sp.]|nr:serine hydrolase [Parafilimonas sp.]